MTEQEIEKRLERDIVNANRAWHANLNDGPVHPDFLARELVAEGWRPLPTQERLMQFLREQGLTDQPSIFSSDIHSWRCSYPERYGACTCLDTMVEELLALLDGTAPPATPTEGTPA